MMVGRFIMRKMDMGMSATGGGALMSEGGTGGGGRSLDSRGGADGYEVTMMFSRLS